MFEAISTALSLLIYTFAGAIAVLTVVLVATIVFILISEHNLRR